MDARTVRVFWANVSTWWFNFNWNGVINPQSVVHISACEANFPAGNLFGAEGVLRQRGAAPIWANTSGPMDQILVTRFRAAWNCSSKSIWGTPLNAATDITVIGEPEQKVVV